MRTSPLPGAAWRRWLVEAWIVRSQGEVVCAKVYKEAQSRSFTQRTAYIEGRKVRNSRDARAMAKRSSFGRDQEEAAWQTAEVDALNKLAAAGVRLPQPLVFSDGVLLMAVGAGRRAAAGAGGRGPR